MEIRVSLASMLTALAILAAPAVSTRAQAPEADPTEETGAPEADIPATDEAAEALELAGPSPERESVLKNVVGKRQARKQAALNRRRMRLQAHFLLVALVRERQLQQAQQASSGGTTASSSSCSSGSCSSGSSSSGSSSSGSSSSSRSPDTPRQRYTPIYRIPTPTPSQPASPPRSK